MWHVDLHDAILKFNILLIFKAHLLCLNNGHGVEFVFSNLKLYTQLWPMQKKCNIPLRHSTEPSYLLFPIIVLVLFCRLSFFSHLRVLHVWSAGIGLALMLQLGIVVIIRQVEMGHVLHYMFECMGEQRYDRMPWAHCNNTWNTYQCCDRLTRQCPQTYRQPEIPNRQWVNGWGKMLYCHLFWF